MSTSVRKVCAECGRRVPKENLGGLCAEHRAILIRQRRDDIDRRIIAAAELGLTDRELATALGCKETRVKLAKRRHTTACAAPFEGDEADGRRFQHDIVVGSQRLLHALQMAGYA